MGGYSKRWSLGSVSHLTHMQNKAVVVGALGVIGRYIVERLVEEPDWQVVGLSRRFDHKNKEFEGIPPRKSLRGLLRKRRQAGSISAVKLGLKNAGANAMPSADARAILCDIVVHNKMPYILGLDFPPRRMNE